MNWGVETVKGISQISVSVMIGIETIKNLLEAQIHEVSNLLNS